MRKTEIEQTRIVHSALRRLIEEATRPQSEGGHMPVETGSLRNSVAVSFAPVTYNFITKKFRDPSDAVNNAIANVEIGETVYIGFRAPYAHKAEAEFGFARLAAQRWPFIVKEAAQSKR
ncbi:MAG: hypothetical protein KIS73_05155 [Enhydrobacter sp.]|nr:hypothetical protein [Enhydrobacter sp.]